MAKWSWEYSVPSIGWNGWRPSTLNTPARTALAAVKRFADYSRRWPVSREVHRLKRDGVVVATMGLRIRDRHEVKFVDGTTGELRVSK